MGACLFLNSMTLLYHLFVPFPHRPRGIIIDFIGLPTTPSVLKIITVDILTILLQALMLLLAYETAHYGKQAILDDSSDLDGEDDEVAEAVSDADVQDIEADADAYANPKTPFLRRNDQDTPIVNLRFRHTLKRIANDKPYTAPSADAANGTAGQGDEARTELIARIRARIRQRQLARNGGAAQGEAVDGSDRLDEGSDEEREVGLSRPGR